MIRRAGIDCSAEQIPPTCGNKMTKLFTYETGEEIQGGDQISYHGEPGTVEFVVSKKTGDSAMDWFIDEFPGGGFMINAKHFGRVFLNTGADEDLEFVSRGGLHKEES
jgi:hypothetical protein